MDNVDLTEAFVKEVVEAVEQEKDIPTWDDFFDKYEVPEDARTEFGCASILRQAVPILRERGIPI